MRRADGCWSPRILVPVFLLGVVVPAGSRASQEWTLDRCEEEALKVSHEVRAGGYRLEQAAAAAQEADAVRWPTLSASGTYAYTSEIMELNLPSVGSFSLPDIRFGDGNVYDVALVAKIPLFTGGALGNRARAERSAVRAARHELAADSLRLVADVRAAYFRTLGVEARAAAARVAEGRLARHLEDLDGAIAVGASSEEARIQALARLRRAEQVLIEAEAAARAERLNLGRIVGYPGTEVAPAGELGQTLLVGPVPEGVGVDARPELFALEARRRRSEDLAAAVRGSYLPSVSAQISVHHAKPGVDPIADEWMQYGAAGVVLSWSLWDWGARAERVRQARVQGRVLEEQRALLHDALENGLAAARSALDSAREQSEKAAERVELERRRLGLVTGRYRNAAASESERLDAEDDLAAAEIDLTAARAGLRLAEVEILYFLGR